MGKHFIGATKKNETYILTLATPGSRATPLFYPSQILSQTLLDPIVSGSEMGKYLIMG